MRKDVCKYPTTTSAHLCHGFIQTPKSDNQQKKFRCLGRSQMMFIMQRCCRRSTTLSERTIVSMKQTNAYRWSRVCTVTNSALFHNRLYDICPPPASVLTANLLANRLGHPHSQNSTNNITPSHIAIAARAWRRDLNPFWKTSSLSML